MIGALLTNRLTGLECAHAGLEGCHFAPGLAQNGGQSGCVSSVNGALG